MPTDGDPKTNPIRQLLAIDRTVHEPARLAILVLLTVVEKADFLYLLDETGLSKGNLSSHTAKLEASGYIEVEKLFVEKIPRTIYRITKKGETALAAYRHLITETVTTRESPQ